ncbi:MAG: TRAP transporter large permease [Chloroflexi bacterium]|nr:TRAP transporter large permease [Chloroflexota bacterium]
MLGLIGLVFGVFVLVGLPLSFAMAMATVAAIWLGGQYDPIIVGHRILQASDSFVLLAIPFFILAGSLMERGGIARRLVHFAHVLVKQIRGGMAMVAIIGEVLFSGISGSTAADVSAIGSLMMPTLNRAGYRPAESASIIAAASAMGILVPPCVMMIVLGGLLNVSVTALFAAGLLPALFMAAVLLAYCWVRAGQLGITGEGWASRREFLIAFVDALLPLGMPVIIFGGIFGGVVTPTEAGAIAVLYALVVGGLIYREITLRLLWHSFLETAIVTSAVMFLVGGSTAWSWFAATEHLPQALLELMLSISGDPSVFLILSVIIFILGGALLEGLPAAIVLLPVLLPTIEGMHINLVHFGTLVVAATGVGLFLPPAGVGLIVVCGVGKVGIEPVVRAFIPYLALLVFTLVVLTYVPQITLILPNILGISVR